METATAVIDALERAPGVVIPLVREVPSVTLMAEKGLPDQTIMVQVGHISAEMMRTYSHIRRLALNEAAAALEPARSSTARRQTFARLNWSISTAL